MSSLDKTKYNSSFKSILHLFRYIVLIMAFFVVGMVNGGSKVEAANVVEEVTSDGSHVAYYESLDTAFSSVSSGNTIKLLSSVRACHISVSKNLTLELNGKSITCTTSSSLNNKVLNVSSGTFIIKDSVGEGSINLNTSSYKGYGVYISGGHVTLNSGTISAVSTYSGSSSSEPGYGVYVGGGLFTMDGGKINSAKPYYSYGLCSGSSSGTIQMNGGEITSSATNYSYGVYTSYFYIQSGGSIVSTSTSGYSYGLYAYGTRTDIIGTITATSTSGTAYGVYSRGDSSSYSITFGTSGGEVSKTSPEINGGLYVYSTSAYIAFYDGIIKSGYNNYTCNNVSTMCSALFDAIESGYGWFDDKNEAYLDVFIEEVDSNGNHVDYHPTLTEAFGDVRSGNTIKLLNDINVCDLVVSGGFNLDLNGKILECQATTYNKYFIEIETEASLHIKDSVGGGSINYKTTYGGGGVIKIANSNSASLYLYSGSISYISTNTSNSEDSSGYGIYNGGAAFISGGNIYVEKPYYGYAIYNNYLLDISGGSIESDQNKENSIGVYATMRDTISIVNITGGTVKGKTGIYLGSNSSGNTLVIGVQGGEVSSDNPEIIGGVQIAHPNVSASFYDGIIRKGLGSKTCHYTPSLQEILSGVSSITTCSGIFDNKQSGVVLFEGNDVAYFSIPIKEYDSDGNFVSNYTTLADAVNNVANGNTLKLFTSFEAVEAFNISSSKNFTIDFNGNSVRWRTGTSMTNEGTLILKNGSLSEYSGGTSHVVINEGTLTLENMSISASSEGNHAFAIENTGSLVVKGSSIGASSMLCAYGIVSTGGSVEVDDGTSIYIDVPNEEQSYVTEAIGVSLYKTKANIKSVTIESYSIYSYGFYIVDDTVELSIGIKDGLGMDEDFLNYEISVSVAYGIYSTYTSTDAWIGFYGGVINAFESVCINDCASMFDEIDYDTMLVQESNMIYLKAPYIQELDSSGNTVAGYDTLQSAFSGAASGNTLKLLKDIDECNVTLASGKTLTLDINGKTIACNSAGASVLKVSGNLIINDSVGTGVLSLNTSSEAGYGVYIYSGGVVNLNSGKISSISTGSSFYQSDTNYGVYNSGTFNMIGGIVYCHKDDQGWAVYNTSIFVMSGGSVESVSSDSYSRGVSNKGGSFTMSGGTISVESAREAYGVHNSDSGTFNMTDGTIRVEVTGSVAYGVYNDNATFALNGGSINSTASSDSYGVRNASTFIMDGGNIVSGTYGVYGSATIKSGTITATAGYGVRGESVVFGEKDGTVSTSMPIINGGISSSTSSGGNFKFYDGVINKGSHGEIFSGYYCLGILKCFDESFVDVETGYGFIEDENKAYLGRVIEEVNSSGQHVSYYSTLATAFSSSVSGNTIKLLSDAYSCDLTVGKTLIFDTNGKTLSCESGSDGIVDLIYNSGNLTIVGNGSIILNNSYQSYFSCGEWGYDDNGDEYCLVGDYIEASVTLIDNQGTLVIDGPTLKVYSIDESYDYDDEVSSDSVVGIDLNRGSSLIFKSGTITVERWETLEDSVVRLDAEAIFFHFPASGGNTITVVIGEKDGYAHKDSPVINGKFGGKYNYHGVNVSVSFYDGIINGVGSNGICSENTSCSSFFTEIEANSTWVYEDDSAYLESTYSVIEETSTGTFVRNYNTLREAFSGAANNNTIKLLNNIEECNVVLSSGKTLTLDTNGKEVVCSTVANSSVIVNNGTLTIIGGGSIQNLNGDSTYDCDDGNTCIAVSISITNNGVLTLENSYIVSDTSFGNFPYAKAIVNNGTFTINGGEIYAYSTSASAYGVYNSGETIINGGKITASSSDGAAIGVSSSNNVSMFGGIVKASMSSSNFSVGFEVLSDSTFSLFGGVVVSLWECYGFDTVLQAASGTTITIGQRDGLYSKSAISMYGNFVINNNSTVNFYDGELIHDYNSSFESYASFLDDIEIGYMLKAMDVYNDGEYLNSEDFSTFLSVYLVEVGEYAVIGYSNDVGISRSNSLNSMINGMLYNNENIIDKVKLTRNLNECVTGILAGYFLEFDLDLNGYSLSCEGSPYALNFGGVGVNVYNGTINGGINVYHSDADSVLSLTNVTVVQSTSNPGISISESEVVLNDGTSVTSLNYSIDLQGWGNLVIGSSSDPLSNSSVSLHGGINVTNASSSNITFNNGFVERNNSAWVCTLNGEFSQCADIIDNVRQGYKIVESEASFHLDVATNKVEELDSNGDHVAYYGSLQEALDSKDFNTLGQYYQDYGNTLKLLTNVNECVVKNASGGAVVLDLNGKTLTCRGSSAISVTIFSITVINGNIVVDSSGAATGIRADEAGNLVLQNVNMTVNGNGLVYGIEVIRTHLTISDSDIKVTNESTSSYTTGVRADFTSIHITSSVIDARGASGKTKGLDFGALVQGESHELTSVDVYGGVFLESTADEAFVDFVASDVNIEAGNSGFTCKSHSKTGCANMGFTIPNQHVWVDDGSTAYIAMLTNKVQELNSSGNHVKYYYTLREAFNGVSDGNILKLLENVSECEITNSNNITLNMNGKTWLCSGVVMEDWNTYTALINNGNLTIIGAGLLKVEHLIGGSPFEAGSSFSNVGIENTSMGTLVLNGVNIEVSTPDVSEGSSTGIKNDGIVNMVSSVIVVSGRYNTFGISSVGTLIIESGEIRATSNIDDGYAIYNEIGMTIGVKDGSVSSDSPLIFGDIHTTEGALNNFYDGKIEGGFYDYYTFESVDPSSYIDDIEKDATIVVEDGVIYLKQEKKYNMFQAYDGSGTLTGNYVTLADAVEKSSSGSTIKFIGNVFECVTISSGKTLTFNLNGKTLSCSKVNGDGNVVAIVNNGTLSISGNGSITVSGGSNNSYAVYNSGTLNVSAGFISATASNAVGIYSNSGSVTISGGTIRSNSTSSSGSAIGVKVNSGSITISGGVISSASDVGDVYGVFNSGTFNMSKGVISATSNLKNARGVYNSSGTSTLTGGAISSTSSLGEAYGVSASDVRSVSVSATSSVTAMSTFGIAQELKEEFIDDLVSVPGGNDKAPKLYYDVVEGIDKPIVCTYGGICDIDSLTFVDYEGILVNNVRNTIVFNGNVVNDIDTRVLGTYTVTSVATDNYGNVSEEIVRTYSVVDNQAPVIKVSSDAIVLRVGDTLDGLYGAKASDNYDNELVIELLDEEVDTSKEGTYKLGYKVVDSNGNETIIYRDVIVKANINNNIWIYIAIGISLLLIGLVGFIVIKRRF